MDKQQILSFIKTQLDTGKISPHDLATLAHSDVVVTPAVSQPRENVSTKSFINVLYVIGALIALIGVIVLIAENWNQIGIVGRITVTLGISLATYIGGMVMSKSIHNFLSQVMFVISGALAPLGAFVLLDEIDITFNLESNVGVSLMLFVLFGVAYIIARKNVLVILTVIYGTWSYYALFAKLIETTNLDTEWLRWATIVLGIAYLFIAYGYTRSVQAKNLEEGKEERAVSGLLYGAGALAIMGAGIATDDKSLWDLLMIPLIFGAFYLSVFVKSRLVLFLAGLFLIIHAIKLTIVYFSDSLSWALALVLCGFMVIAIGYLTYYVHRKYIAQK
jgi:uncharacterized membrane protein